MNNNLNRFKLKLPRFEQKLKQDKTQKPVMVVKIMANQLNSLTTIMKKTRKRRTIRLASLPSFYDVTKSRNKSGKLTINNVSRTVALCALGSSSLVSRGWLLVSADDVLELLWSPHVASLFSVQFSLPLLQRRRNVTVSMTHFRYS